MAREELDIDTIMADVEVTLADPEGNKSVVILVDQIDASNLQEFLYKEAEFEFEEATERGVHVDIYDDFWAVLNDKFRDARRTLDEETSLELLELNGRDIKFIGGKLVASHEIYSDPYYSFINIYDEFVREGGRPDMQLKDQVLLLSSEKIPYPSPERGDGS